jgi:hypothetical protein
MWNILTHYGRQWLLNLFKFCIQSFTIISRISIILEAVEIIFVSCRPTLEKLAHNNWVNVFINSLSDLCSVPTYQKTWRHYPENRKLYFNRCQNPKILCYLEILTKYSRLSSLNLFVYFIDFRQDCPTILSVTLVRHFDFFLIFQYKIHN